MKYLTFALAKGRLAKKSLALFEQIGISMDEMKDPDTRKLIFVNEDLKIKMFLAKASDVPTTRVVAVFSIVTAILCLVALIGL